MFVPGIRRPQGLSILRPIFVSTRLVHGKKSVDVWADADTGWHQSQIGLGIAHRLGIPGYRKLARTQTAWAAASERIPMRKAALDRLEILNADGSPMCSIGPIILNVTTHPVMANDFMLGPDLMALLRTAIVFEGLKRNLVFCDGPGTIPADEKYRGKIRAVPKWIMTGCRIQAGDREIVQHAEFDTGAEATVVGTNVAARLGFPYFAMMARSRTRMGGGGGRAAAFRMPVDKIEFLKEDGSTPCSVGPVAVLVTDAFEPDSIRIGRDIMNAIRLRLFLDETRWGFECQTP